MLNYDINMRQNEYYHGKIKPLGSTATGYYYYRTLVTFCSFIQSQRAVHVV